MDPVAEQECLGIAFHNRRLKAARFSHSGFSASHLRADAADDTAGKHRLERGVVEPNNEGEHLRKNAAAGAMPGGVGLNRFKLRR
jgi:hypothetical protein